MTALTRAASRMAGVVAVAACALGAAACNSNNSSTSSPTPPTTTVTETFSGQLSQNGATTYNFSAASAGGVTATLTALQPDETLVIGVALGTWNGTQCTLIVTNDAATKGSIVSGTVSGALNLCARVYDVGNVVTPITYSIEVAHP